MVSPPAVCNGCGARYAAYDPGQRMLCKSCIAAATPGIGSTMKNATGCTKSHIHSERGADTIQWCCRHCKELIFVAKLPSASARLHAINCHIHGAAQRPPPLGVNLWGVADRIKPLVDAAKRGSLKDNRGNPIETTARHSNENI